MKDIEVNAGVKTKNTDNTYYYNFSHDLQAHLNDAGLGGATPDWLIKANNYFKGATGYNLIPDRFIDDVHTDLTRENVQTHLDAQTKDPNIDNKKAADIGNISSSLDPAELIPLVGLLVGVSLVIAVLKR